MSVKDYLSRYHLMEQRIKRMKAVVAEFERLAATIPGCNFDLFRVDGTKKKEAPFVKWIYKALENEQEIKELIIKLPVVKKEIISTINELENSEYKRLLILRYIDWLSWRAIADIMLYSPATIRRWHDKAIIEIKVAEK
ncbi:MAG: DUF1492 domain-containing protein [Bacilli bacterium]|nr:DUF1492 domain-containing protein [Acholeplasmataceae bacterium]